MAMIPLHRVEIWSVTPEFTTLECVGYSRH